MFLDQNPKLYIEPFYISESSFHTSIRLNGLKQYSLPSQFNICMNLTKFLRLSFEFLLCST